MALIDFPSSPYAASVTWRLIQPTQTNLNQWTGKRHVFQRDRGWFECDFELPPLVGQEAYYRWRGFLAQASNQENTFRVPVEQNEQNGYSLGSQGDAARVNGSGQTGRAVNTTGWRVAGTNTPTLPAGAFVTIGDQLVSLTASADGASPSLEFEPPLRRPSVNGESVSWLRPYCVMFLTETPNMSVTPGFVSGLRMTFREAF